MRFYEDVIGLSILVCIEELGELFYNIVDEEMLMSQLLINLRIIVKTQYYKCLFEESKIVSLDQSLYSTKKGKEITLYDKIAESSDIEMQAQQLNDTAYDITQEDVLYVKSQIDTIEIFEFMKALYSQNKSNKEILNEVTKKYNLTQKELLYILNILNYEKNINTMNEGIEH